MAAVAASSLALLMAQTALANEPPTPVDEVPQPTPSAWRLTSETWRLPGSERMGMVSGHVLFDVADELRLGVASYGAVRGDRGGFITLGASGEWRPYLSPSWRGHVGLFVGAGGGRGGLALAGGGLMWRTDVGVSREVGRYGSVGVGISHVNFPSGAIRSTQPYVMYEHAFDTLLGPRGMSQSGLDRSVASAWAIRDQEFALVTRRYQIPGDVRQDDGSPQHGSMQLLGVEWLSYLNDRWFVKVGADGAMGGSSAGYMQILAGAGYRQPVTRSGALKLHAALGPAGGGNVDTGGGLLVDAGVAWQQQLTRRTALELGLSEVRAPSRSFKAHSLALKLNHQFGLPSMRTERDTAGLSLAGLDVAPLRVRVASQTYVQGSSNWRNGDPDQSVSNLGVQLDYFVSPQWFVTGQGLAAYAGKAGAYMTGQVGAGGHWPLSQRWFVEGEGLVGAAGGGGLNMGNGLVVQLNASLGYRVSPSLSLMTTLGRISAVRGDMKAQVLGVSLGYEFVGLTVR